MYACISIVDKPHGTRFLPWELTMSQLNPAYSLTVCENLFSYYSTFCTDVFQVVFLLQVFQLKYYMHSSDNSGMLHIVL